MAQVRNFREISRKFLRKFAEHSSFGRLNQPGQYSQTAQDIATVMTNAVLDCRVDLDERVEYMVNFPESS
jgi:hypothetical protein